MRPLPLGTAEADRLLADLAPEERSSSWHLVVDPPAASGLERLRAGARAERFSAGAALAPALGLLPRGRRPAALVGLFPRVTELGYRWVADHRGLLGRFVTARARRWADRVIDERGGPERPQ